LVGRAFAEAELAPEAANLARLVDAGDGKQRGEP
jgi:hypothetical protein